MNREALEKLEKNELIEIILAMEEQIKTMAQKIKEHQARLDMDSSNSSKPPSSDNQWSKTKSQRKKSGKKPGGQHGHKGHGLKIESEPDETVELKPAECEKCKADISKEEGAVADVRYKIDVKVRKETTRYKQLETTCPACGHVNKGRFPFGINSRIQYGEGLQAASVMLTNYAMVGYDKTQKILNDVFGVPIRGSTIANHVKRFAQKSAPVLSEIKSKLKESSVLHFDETGVRVNGQTQWLHTASNSEATYNTVHSNRGSAGTDDNGVLKEFAGTAVHDCWKTYFKYKNCVHALCNAHLLRELQGVIDNTGQAWAGQMQDLLLEMKEVAGRYKEDGKEALSYYYHKRFARAYERIVKLGEEENPIEEGPKKRGKPRCLLERFIKYRPEICRFADDFTVPFDNNQAERDIRNAKVKQKVSGCFRSDDGARNFGKISSVIGTAIKQGLSAFNAIAGIIKGSTLSLFRNSPVTE